ncbi:MAG: tetratricopeptide repeat protein, partial [bacterium]
MQWNKIRSESPDTGRIAELLVEGEKIIQRLQELEDLRKDPQKSSREDFFQRIASLQERFKYLLFNIEMTRLTTLPEGEVEGMRSRYISEKQQLLDKIRALEDTIIVRGEHFLSTYKQQIALKHYMNKQEMIVDFIYRLAEIYYRRAEETFFRTNDIAVFKPALEKYQRIIDEFPASEYIDDALYNIAYVKNNSQSLDERLEAITFYLTLITKYSNSPFVPEAYWRVADHHFNQTPPDVDKAILYYSELLNYPYTNWYARSLYKIGWCHFTNADYPLAINFFTRTVETSMDYDAGAEDVVFASMMDEALEYISVCFAQDSSEWTGSGVAAAVAFVEEDSIRRDTYGKQILEYLGDIYRLQVGKYPLAIEAFKAYLDLYPANEKAPWIQEKIINCYAVNLRQFENAYNEKDRMFAQYRAGEEWDQANPDPQLRSDADVIIEKYYFQNINEMIGRSLKTSDRTQFENSVMMSRNYLDAFSRGPNAYTVNYNLAILLDQHVVNPDEAFTEYIKVSKEYTDDKHRKDAAVNAVVIAQRMISEMGELSTEEIMGLELREPEQKYVDAVENYLAHFPQGEEAELFLLNTGSIYYNHGFYEQSRPYYNTLLEDFPQGERRGDAYYFIMDGYFAEENYAEAESVAKNIQQAGFDSTMVAKARTRQAESVFQNAQAIKEQGDLLAAAEEYRRAAMETPDYDQADKALFESGLTFQQAQSWNNANDVYLHLVANYPGSELADKALYNVGYNNQSELADYKTAAETFERLSLEYPNSSLTQDALRNASINYVEAEDWQGAIRVNSAYMQMFSDAPDANLFLFENAGLYLKMGDEASADKIYAAYTEQFPDDPRAVRARWERGQYLKDNERLSEALVEFAAGIETHRALVAGGGTGEETYASRCLFEVTQSDLQTYEHIQFAPASAVESNKQRKLAQREYLLGQLEELNNLAKDEMFEGLYTVGKVEEELSRAFAEQT